MQGYSSRERIKRRVRAGKKAKFPALANLVKH